MGRELRHELSDIVREGYFGRKSAIDENSALELVRYAQIRLLLSFHRVSTSLMGSYYRSETEGSYPIHLPTHDRLRGAFNDEVAVHYWYEDKDAEEAVLIDDNICTFELTLRN